MTYGECRLRITQLFPKIGPEIIEGFIADVYTDILHELPWKRQNFTGVLQTIAPYVTGTATVTEGSTAVVGVGTTWTSAMTGRAFRVTGRSEFYEFTYVSATSGTLDRAYEGDTATAAYSIFQHVYLMPTDCRMLEDSTFSPLKRVPHNTGVTTGEPTIWASYMDDASTPPRMQVKLYPIPDAVYGLPFTYQAETALPGSSVALLPWIQTSALIEGVMAKCCASPEIKDYAGAAYHAGLAQKALSVMRGAEAQGMEPMTMQLQSFFTSHRAKRWNQ